MTNIEDRLAEAERKIQNLVEVCAAVADDTLRMCFILDELHRVAKMPPMPWDLATTLVELHHAMSAAKDDLKDEDGVTAAQRVEELKGEVTRLRSAYRESLIGGP